MCGLRVVHWLVDQSPPLSMVGIWLGTCSSSERPAWRGAEYISQPITVMYTPHSAPALPATTLTTPVSAPRMLEGSSCVQRCFDCLDLSCALPLQLRLDAITQLQVAHAEGLADFATEWRMRASSSLQLLVSSLLWGPEELGDAIIDLLEMVLGVAQELIDTKQGLLQCAESEICACTHHCKPAPLLGLLAIVLRGDGAGAAANSLCERSQLMGALMRCMEGDADDGTVNTEDAVAVALCTFVRLIEAHGAAPSAILLRCGLSIARFTAMLLNSHTNMRRRATYPSEGLLRLLTVLSGDPMLAPEVCNTSILAALRPVLLCGVPTLQLAAVELCAALQRASPHCSRILCFEDIDGFLLEIARDAAASPPQATLSCHMPTRDRASADDSLSQLRSASEELTIVVWQLLELLLAEPRRNPGSLCARLLDVILHARAANGAPERFDQALTMHQFACVSSLLEWYRPSLPREYNRIAQFCAVSLSLFLRRPPTAAQMTAAASGEERLLAGLRLVRLATERCADHAHASSLLLEVRAPQGGVCVSLYWRVIPGRAHPSTMLRRCVTRQCSLVPLRSPGPTLPPACWMICCCCCAHSCAQSCRTR